MRMHARVYALIGMHRVLCALNLCAADTGFASIEMVE